MARRGNVPWLDTEDNGFFYAFWYDREAGRTRRLSLGTREAIEAQRRFAAFLIEHSGGQIERAKDAAGQTLTVGMAIDAYKDEHLRAKKGLQEGAPEFFTLANVEKFFGMLPVVGITNEIVEQYIVKRATGAIGRPSTAGTHIKELTLMRAAFGHAVKKRRIAATDLPDFEMPEQPEAKDRWLTRAELDALFGAAADMRGTRLSRTYRFVTMAYYTAARRGAVRELQWFQIDQANGKIRLNPAGRRQTRKRRPTVPIFAELAPIIQRAWDERRGPFWLDDTGSIRTGFEGAVDRAGLENVTPHTLRHTRAVHLAQAGVSLYAIAGLLGDSIKTVERNYLHHCPSHIRAEVERAQAERDVGQNLG